LHEELPLRGALDDGPGLEKRAAPPAPDAPPGDDAAIDTQSVAPPPPAGKGIARPEAPRPFGRAPARGDGTEAAPLSPFPTIPEAVRRSILERASSADPGAGPKSQKTTLGDLAERLQEALTRRDQGAAGEDAGPRSAPAPVAGPGEAETPRPPAEAFPEPAPERGREGGSPAVIDFSPRRDGNDSLEEEMARLLNELTGETTRR